MKRILSSVVLICLVLQCLTRMGAISYLYGKRHEIAYSLGMSTEKVIALCSSDYFHQKNFKIQHDEKRSTPLQLTAADEINLYFEGNFIGLLHGRGVECDRQFLSRYLVREYNSPPPVIFHPPLS